MIEDEQNILPEKRVWGFWATTGFGLVIGLTTLVTCVIGLIVFVVISPRQIAEVFSDLGLVTSVISFPAAIVAIGLTMVIIKTKRGATIAEYLGFQLITRKAILILLAYTAGFVVVSDLLTIVLGKPINPESMVESYNTSVWPVLLWIAVIILAPLGEEIFFRGFLFAGFRQSRMGLYGTIALTSFIWALLHLQYDFYGIATIFTGGIFLGIAHFKTDSLWSPILIHAFFNLIGTLQVAFDVNSMFS